VSANGPGRGSPSADARRGRRQNGSGGGPSSVSPPGCEFAETSGRHGIELELVRSSAQRRCRELGGRRHREDDHRHARLVGITNSGGCRWPGSRMCTAPCRDCPCRVRCRARRKPEIRSLGITRHLDLRWRPRHGQGRRPRDGRGQRRRFHDRSEQIIRHRRWRARLRFGRIHGQP